MEGRNDVRNKGRKEERGGVGQLVKERSLRKIRRCKGGKSKKKEGFCVSWFTFWRSSTNVSLFYTPLLLKGFVFAC